MNPSPAIPPLPQRHSIRTRIALLVAGVAGTAVALFTLATWQEVRQAALELGAERLVASARPIATSISATGDLLLEGARITAELPEVRSFLADPSDQTRAALLEAFAEAGLPGDPELEIRSAAGERIFSSDGLLPPADAAVGSPEAGAGAGAGDAWVTPLVHGVAPAASDGEPPIFFGAAAQVGAGDGVLGTVLNWRIIETTPQALAMVRGFISPDAGVFLADPGAGVWTDFVGGVPAPELGDAPFAHLPLRTVPASGSAEGLSYMAMVPVPPTPWVVGVSLPRGVILEETDRLVRWLVVAGILLVLASAFIGWFVAGRVTRGLDALSAAAHQLRLGNDETRVAIARSDEVGVLASAFNAMAERVSESRKSLEAKVREVSDREAEAREVRQRLEHLVASSRAILFRYDLPAHESAAAADSPGPSTTNIRWISDNLRWILALDPAAAEAPLWWDDRIHPDDRASVQARAACLGEEESVVMEYRFLHGDGNYRWLRDERRVRSDPREEDESASGTVEVVGVLSDITQSRNLELAHAAAEGANRAKTEFLSRMSHELRTPLTAVLGFGRLIQEDAKDEVTSEHAVQVVRAGEHLLALIEEVLDITGIETGRSSVSAASVDVVGVMAEAADLVRFIAAERGVTLTVRPSDSGGPLRVEADRQRLKQVLVNLLTNGIKYNRTGGHVEIGAASVGEDRVRIVVADTGPGIPEEMQARLFVPFDRLGMEHSEPEGTGLGLPLSKALVEAMNGRLDVSSGLGRGSEFQVELPVALDAGVGAPGGGAPGGEGSSRDAAVQAPTAPLPGPAGSGTVLVVEDHPANLKLFRRIFRRRPEVELLTAETGTEGIRMAARHRPDLVLLDLNLPDIGGEEVLAGIRSHAELQHTTVVMISGDASPAQAQRLLGLGAHAYLFKPFNIASLLEMVDERLAAGAGGARGTGPGS